MPCDIRSKPGLAYPAERSATANRAVWTERLAVGGDLADGTPRLYPPDVLDEFVGSSHRTDDVLRELPRVQGRHAATLDW
jgi:hypothetical protein